MCWGRTGDAGLLNQSGRWGPYRQASPPPARHRPGARSARRGRCLSILSRTASQKETTMWFRSPVRYRNQRRQVSSFQRSRRRHTTGLRVEALEARSLLSGIITLAPSDDSPLVGEPVVWTATATDVGATPVYQ